MSQVRIKGQRLNPLTHHKIQVTGGEVSFEFPKFRSQWLLKASHITLLIKLYHSSNIRTPGELLVYVCLSVLLETI